MKATEAVSMIKVQTPLDFVVKRLVTYLFAVFCTCRVLVEKHRQELTVQREFPAGVRARETEIAVGYNAVNAGTLMQITFLPIQV